jgi:hypothetical protein
MIHSLLGFYQKTAQDARKQASALAVRPQLKGASCSQTVRSGVLMLL